MAHTRPTKTAQTSTQISQKPAQVQMQSPSSMGTPILQRQASCACGGGCPRCQSDRALPGNLQTNLAISEPGDRDEREADRIAATVMGSPATHPPVPAARPGQASIRLGREPLPAQVRLPGGGGQPLSPALRHFFEPRFGQDLSQVRLHTDPASATTAQALNARAFALGNSVVFGPRQYAPQTSVGRQLIAHELTHVLQQANANYPRIQRAELQVGNLTIHIDFGPVVFTPQAGQAARIEALYTAYTGAAPTSTTQSAIAALSPTAQRWVLFALPLLIDNTTAQHSRLNRDQAVQRLIAHAPSALTRPLSGGTNAAAVMASVSQYVNEVFRVSGWFEVALTASLTAPTGQSLTDINLIVNPPPTSGAAASAPVDVAVLTARLVPALTHLLNHLDPANRTSVGTRSLSAFQTLGDLLLPEARAFFSPYANTAINNIFDLTPRWHASANIFSVTTMTPTQDQRLGYLLNRANIVGRNTRTGLPHLIDTNIFSDVNFDGSRPADRQALFNIVSTMEQDPAIQPIVDRLLQNTGRQEGAGPTTRIGLVTEYDASRFTACAAHWQGIDTLCHELLHALVHADFVAAAGRVSFGQVLREGFTEVLGVQLFNDHVVPKASRDSAFKTALEAGVSGAPCPVPAAATIDYGDAGSGAETIRQRVGNTKFRAAYFLGRPDLVGL